MAARSRFHAAYALCVVQAAATAVEGERPDPQRGLAVLHGVALQGFGLEAEHFQALWTAWPEPLRSEADGASAEERRQLLFDRYGLFLDPERLDADGRPSTVPAAFAESEPGRWTLSCLACHSGSVDGRFVNGLGNNRFAFQTLVRDLVRYKVQNRISLTEQERGMAFVPLGSTDGTTNAQIFSIVLASFRETDLDRAPRRRSIERALSHDLDAPALWNVRWKSRLYLDGYVDKDPRVLMQFALGLANDGETIRGWDVDFDGVLAWIESLEAPKWPGPLDRGLADAGRSVFDAHCAKCHGKYEGEVRYPEKVVPLDVVLTDPVRAEAMPRSFREWMSKSWLTHEGEVDVDLDPDGYVAPPLVGVWATAPYFHNGSVPTLWHVLHPDERPAVWQHDRDRDFDPDRVGLAVVTADKAPDADGPASNRRWFDTGKFGKSAQGHTFPARLEVAERRALLEYLKTL
ncbi:MAG: cytochrome c [Planctomycetota bacterium]